jgi:hypothetical protein
MTRRLIGTQPSFEEPKSGVRVALDALIQASLVELFGSYGVGCAPLPRGSPSSLSIPEVTAVAAFRSADSAAGKLTLSLPAALLEQMKSGEPTALRMDWARELTNQLAGRIKNRLLPFGVRLDMGPVSLLDAKLLHHQLHELAGVRVYAGRTLRGLVLVSAQGLPENSLLTYQGGAGAAEGSLLWL